MSLLEFLQRFIFKTHNPDLDTARKKHDNLPKTEYGKDSRLSESEIERDIRITHQRSYELGKMLKSAIEEHYSPLEQDKVRDSILRAMQHLATKARIFPDMDYVNIWYTDYYDLIELAKKMKLGDDTLPHWPEETNPFKRYLEITAFAGMTTVPY